MKSIFRPSATGNDIYSGETGQLQAYPESFPIPAGATAFLGESLDAIRAAHSITYKVAPPQRAHVIPTRDFIRRIPDATWAKVQAAAAQSVALDKALFQLSAGAEVHSDNAELIGMLAQLVAGGVITSAERNFILAF